MPQRAVWGFSLSMDNENEMMRAIGRIEGQLSSLLSLESARTRAISMLEKRVTTVESRVTRAYGVVAGVTAAGAVVGYVVRAIIGAH